MQKIAIVGFEGGIRLNMLFGLGTYEAERGANQRYSRAPLDLEL